MVVASPGCTMTGSGGMGVRFKEGTRFATVAAALLFLMPNSVVLPEDSLHNKLQLKLFWAKNCVQTDKCVEYNIESNS